MKNFTNSKKYSLLLTITLLMATLTVTSVYIVAPVSAQAASDWPMFHRDPAFTGVSSIAGPSRFYVKWRYLTDGIVVSSCAVVGGKCYVGSYDSVFYCLDGGTGTLIWSYDTGAAVESSPAVADGNVYFGSDDTYIYCLNAATGNMVWNKKTGAPVASSPNVVDGKVYIGSMDHYVYCLDAATGTTVWTFETEDRIWRNSPSVYEDKVYITSLDENLYCLDAANGTLIWNWDSEHAFALSDPVVVDDRVYLGNDHAHYPHPSPDNFFCLNATTGEMLWSFGVPMPYVSNLMQCTACVYGGRAYVPFYGVVYCLDAVTGRSIWKMDTGFTQRSAPAYALGKLYYGNRDRSMYIVDAESGDQLWSYYATSFDPSPALADGNIYIGGGNGYIYCLADIVAKISPSINCNVFPTSVDYGLTVTVTGNVFPGVVWAGLKVTYTKPDDSTWTEDVISKADGNYYDTFKPDQIGDWSVQVSFDGDPDYNSATSTSQSFTVTGTLPPTATKINCWLDPTTLPSGDTTWIRGAIMPAVSGATVTLTYTQPDGTTTTQTQTSGADGSYEDTYTPDTRGAWSVKASWPGSATQKAATSSTAYFTVTAAPVEPEEEEAAAFPMEYVYLIVAVIVVVVALVAVFLYMKRK